MKINRIQTHFYQLTGMQRPRRGALLRFDFQEYSADGKVENLIGYADCHPWEENGDYSLRDQLHLLARGKLTKLTSRSLYFAKLDAIARRKGISLFEGLKIPPSHRLIPDLATWNDSNLREGLDQGFTHFKIKLGRNLKRELPLLKGLLKGLVEEGRDEIKLRLDFNGALSREHFKQVLFYVKDNLGEIDFFEDPFDVNSCDWNISRKNRLVSFARDKNSGNEKRFNSSVDVIVIKPAIQPCNSFTRLRYPQRFVVTSYLDHPIGQMTASYEAANLINNPQIKLLHCGLVTHLVYNPNAFSEQLKIHKSCLEAPQGTGFGFDELLKNSAWINLV